MQECKNILFHEEIAHYLFAKKPLNKGHENRTTTEIYLLSAGEDERVAMNILEKGFCEKYHTESHTKTKLGQIK